METTVSEVLFLHLTFFFLDNYSACMLVSVIAVNRISNIILSFRRLQCMLVSEIAVNRNFLNLIVSFSRLQCMLVTEIAVKRILNLIFSFKGYSVRDHSDKNLKLTFVPFY